MAHVARVFQALALLHSQLYQVTQKKLDLARVRA